MFLVINSRMRRLWRGIFSGNEHVLDVGCGDAPRYHRFIPGNIVCGDRAAAKKADVLLNAHSLPFKDKSFEGVVCVNSLYYYEDPGFAIGEFSRVLRKNGKLVVVTPFIYPLHDAPHDKYRFTEHGLKGLLQGKFAVERIVPVGGIFSVPVVMVHSLRKGIPLMMPKGVRKFMTVFCGIVFFIPGVLAEFVSVLDVLDRTGR